MKKKPKDFPEIIKKISISWLIFCTAFFLGVYVYAAKKWPYPVIHTIQSFVAGDVAESTTVAEKLINDFRFKPARHIVKNTTAFPDQPYQTLQDLPLKGIGGRETPLAFISKDALQGYRAIHGVFGFEKTLHGVILLGPDNRVKHIWYISQEDVDWNHQPDDNVYPHGFDIAPDGTIAVAFDGGTSLTKYDACSRIVWRIKGGFHHSIAFDGQGRLWSWGGADSDQPYGQNLVQVDYDTGAVIRQFHLFEVYDTNPDIDILGIMQTDTKEGSSWMLDMPGDMWHANDIDPLPPALAEAYPQFTAGDLLISLRSPNLIFVLDPDTLKIKWWRQGLVRRQHDPDWNDQGTITIFNNNMHRGFSSIVELDPVTFAAHKAVPGEPYGFYTWMRGNHDRLPNGGFLITSTEQGRVFEVNPDGRVTFEFINKFGAGAEFLAVSAARFLPLDFFEKGALCRD